jgi:hypothetical protein
MAIKIGIKINSKLKFINQFFQQTETTLHEQFLFNYFKTYC